MIGFFWVLQNVLIRRILYLLFLIFLWWAKVLSIMEAIGLSCPLLQCERLTLDTLLDKSEVTGIACMFESSPNLETLDINLSCSCVSEVCFLMAVFPIFWISFQGMCKNDLHYIVFFNLYLACLIIVVNDSDWWLIDFVGGTLPSLLGVIHEPFLEIGSGFIQIT